MNSQLHTKFFIPLLALSGALLLLGAAQEPGAQPAPAGWVVNPANGSVYGLVLSAGVSWTDARDQAGKLTTNGLPCRLATLTSAQESEFIAANFAGEIGTQGFGFWLGGYQEDGVTPPEAGWKWVTGETWGYTDWGNGEPSDFHGPASEQYLSLWGSQAPGEQSWNDEALTSNIKGYLVECNAARLAVQIDIRPGDALNRVRLGAPGALPVALFSTPSFDARQVDPGSVRLAGATPVHWRRVDINRDGVLDLLLRFSIQDLQLDAGSTRATLTGRTLAGLPFRGTDMVTLGR